MITTTTTIQNNGNDTGHGLPLFPQIDFAESDYSRPQMRLELHDDMIVAVRFDITGQVERSYLLDPEDVAAALAGKTVSTGLLPPGCLFWQQVGGDERLAVYVPPLVRRVRISGRKTALRVPMPGLVVLGYRNEYKFWAVKDAPPLSEETKLYLMPSPNVYGGNGVCQGNVTFPAASTATMEQAVELFFESEFSGHLVNGKSRAYEGDILKQWQALHKAKADMYPPDDLVEAGKSLKSIINE